jgi:thioredoxin-dependent peroxiredoxin
VDGVDAQRKFAEKFDVPFPLLCDTDKSLSRAYGVLGGGGSAARATFVIDSGGVVRKVWPKVSPPAHPGEVITALKALS